MNTPKDYLESIGIKDRTIRVLTFNDKNFMLTDLMLDYAKLYAESQVKTCDLADVMRSANSYNDLKAWLLVKKNGKRLCDWDDSKHQEIWDKMLELEKHYA